MLTGPWYEGEGLRNSAIFHDDGRWMWRRVDRRDHQEGDTPSTVAECAWCATRARQMVRIGAILFRCEGCGSEVQIAALNPVDLADYGPPPTARQAWVD